MRRTGAPGPAAAPQQPQRAPGARGFGGAGNVAGLAGQGGQAQNPGFMGGGGGPSAAAGAGADGPDGIFTPVSRALGVEGRAIHTPAFAGIGSQRIPLVVLIIAAGLSMFEPRYGLAFGIICLIYMQNRNADPGAGAAGAPGAGGQATGHHAR